MKVLLSILLFLIVRVNSYSNPLKKFEIRYSNLTSSPTKILPPFDSIINLEMLEQLDELYKHENVFKIIQINNELLALPNGFLDVFKWEKNRWKNLYKGKYGGHNFGSHKFIYDDELYSFGGYGYWQYNNVLIKFNRTAGGWDFVTKLNSKDALIGPFCSLDGDKLIVIGGVIESKNGLLPNKYEYTIDIESKSCTSANAKYLAIFETIDDHKTSILTFTNTLVQYCQERNNYYMLMYNTNDKQYYTSELKTPLPTASPLIYNDYKSLVFFDSDSTTHLLTESDLINKALAVGKLNKESNTANVGLGLFLLISFLLSIAGYFYARKKANRKLEENTLLAKLSKNKEQQENENSILKYLEALTKIENTTITSSQLDILLEINQLDIDSQRARRSQLIKSINKLTLEKVGYHFIHRIRDEKDKRYINYQIGNPTKQALQENPYINITN